MGLETAPQPALQVQDPGLLLPRDGKELDGGGWEGDGGVSDGRDPHIFPYPGTLPVDAVDGEGLGAFGTLSKHPGGDLEVFETLVGSIFISIFGKVSSPVPL